MKVAIYSRGLEDGQIEDFRLFLNELHQHKIQPYFFDSFIKNYSEIFNICPEHIITNNKELDSSFECVISVGGDGTMLDAVALIKNKNIPLLGINFGRLGFLAAIGKNEYSAAVDALIHGTFVIDKRTLIHLNSNISLFNDTPFALNEFAIHKKDNSPMIRIHTYLNGEFLNSYWADGLIVSTPTGSTGYNMSCNGPIIFPESSSFVITSVAPHNLNIRPIVVPDSHVISFEVEGRTDQFICALDARREIVDKNVQLAVKKEKFTINLLRLNENSFLSTLRTKLTWGLDKRN